MDQTRRRFLLLPESAKASTVAQRRALHSTPSIDVQRCNGCDACVRICAEEALRIDRTSAGLAYVIDPRRCSGCLLCVDVCDQNAVVVMERQAAATVRVELIEGICATCGATFHQPSEIARTPSMCRICRSRPAGRGKIGR